MSSLNKISNEDLLEIYLELHQEYVARLEGIGKGFQDPTLLESTKDCKKDVRHEILERMEAHQRKDGEDTVDRI